MLLSEFLVSDLFYYLLRRTIEFIFVLYGMKHDKDMEYSSLNDIWLSLPQIWRCHFFLYLLWLMRLNSSERIRLTRSLSCLALSCCVFIHFQNGTDFVCFVLFLWNGSDSNEQFVQQGDSTYACTDTDTDMKIWWGRGFFPPTDPKIMIRCPSINF